MAVGFDGIESTEFSVLRVKRDIFSRSRVGMIFTDRSESTIADGSNQLYGIDGQFNFLDDFEISTYAAKTDTPGLSGMTRATWATSLTMGIDTDLDLVML
ncbi:MAG: hypothetical protein CM1200mP40_19560 [Gammaproteobacteria bacterium]|nr:MAG: hypothetical protein CM1200mP40_19560 [Gammaproteobacteria bacterium]